jgi:hypothetical protein
MSNGAWVEEYQGQHYYGQWKTTDDKDAIEVTRANGSKLHYKLADDGKTSRRDEGGLTYYRTK